MKSALVICLILICLEVTTTNKVGDIIKKIVKPIPIIGDVIDIGATVKDIVDWVNEEKSVDDLSERMEDITMMLFEFGEILDEMNVIFKLIKNLPDQLRLELRLNDLINYLTFIKIYYSQFEKYIPYWETVNNNTKKDFCRNVVSNNPRSVIYMIEKIYTHIVPTGSGIANTGIFGLLLKYLGTRNYQLTHALQQSPQQILISFYKSIALAEVRAYAMTQFSYKALTQLGDGDFKTEAKLAECKYKFRMNKINEAFKNATELASRDFWRIDPQHHVKGESYEDIKGLADAVVVHIKQTSPGTCVGTCETRAPSKIQCDKNDKWCKNQRIKCLKVENCITMQWNIEVCDSEDPSRGYRYVKDNGRMWGQQGKCTKKPTKKTGWVEVFNGWDCPYCLCTCVKEILRPNSTIYINLRASLANFKENKVVTGIRFVEHNSILHLQIQEGKLLPYGNIDINQVEWVPVENYKVTDKFVSEGQDYHRITWESRAIDLDQLTAKDGYLITGVRFKRDGQHIKLQILQTPFDHKMGKLIEPQIRSVFQVNVKTPYTKKNPRTEIKLEAPDVPTKSTSSERDSQNNQYVKLRPSDLKKDVAQTIVPYFDIQPVSSSVPVPLQGIGLFHKGRKGYGGFIAPTIETYDVSKHIKIPFSIEDDC